MDTEGNPVGGATISGYWVGATSDSDSGETDASGQVTLQSDAVWKPDSGTTFTFVIDDINKEGWTYDSATGVTSNSIIV